MALAAKLQLRQSQSLVMTPQLMQSIRLLQLTHIELERFVDEEIERNPFWSAPNRSEDAASDRRRRPKRRRGRCRRRLVPRPRRRGAPRRCRTSSIARWRTSFPTIPARRETARTRPRRRNGNRPSGNGSSSALPEGFDLERHRRRRRHAARPCRRADRASPSPIRRRG